MNTKKLEKKKGRLSKIIFYTMMSIIGLLLVLVFITVVLTHQSNNPPSVFGYHLFIIRSESMEPTIPLESAILVKKVDPKDLQPKDIITFKEGVDENGTFIINTHIITQSIPTDSGISFITKGENNKVADSKRRMGDDIYGKVVGIMPAMGKFILFVQSPIGLVTCIAVPLLLLLLFEILNLMRLAKTSVEEDDIVTYEDRADLFGTHSSKPVNLKKKMKQKVQEGDELVPPIRPISTTLYQSKEEKSNVKPLQAQHDELISPKSDDEPQIRSERIIAKNDAQPELRTKKIVTRQEEEEEILNNMNAFAILRSKEETQQDEMHVLEQFRNQETDMAVISNTTTPEFSGTLKSKGNDSFTINGIDVDVKPNAIKLAFDETMNGREISVTVTEGYTNVVVDGQDFEVSFGLFKDDTNQARVTIQKHNK